MNKKTIADIMNCPVCNSENTYMYGHDDVDFGYDGTGHYMFYCSCKDCKHNWKAKMEFTYEVTN